MRQLGRRIETLSRFDRFSAKRSTTRRDRTRPGRNYGQHVATVAGLNINRRRRPASRTRRKAGGLGRTSGLPGIKRRRCSICTSTRTEYRRR